MHNPSIQVSNATREILLKYYYSSKGRKGLMYHLSASAIKFIRDLARENEQKTRQHWSRRKSTRSGPHHERENSAEANKLLNDLVDGERGRFWARNESNDESSGPFGNALDVDPDHAQDYLPDDFQLNSGHLCMIIKPQVALRSEIDEHSTVILTAFRAQFKVFSVVDTQVRDDAVNSLVLHQTFATLDGLQVFYPREQTLGGEVINARSPFVPLETLVDLRVEPYGFDRLVPRMSAALRYDKFNELRMRAKSDASAFAKVNGGGPQVSHFNTGTGELARLCVSIAAF